jgi:hypothetical protein
MAVLIGVDEAGYGPNYGPLCVAATAWRVPEEKAEGAGRKAEGSFPDLYKLLRKAVVRSPDKAGRKLAIADSKALYTAGGGVELLERGVLAAMASMAPREYNGSGTLPAYTSGCVERVSELLAVTAADPLVRRAELACHSDDEQSLPIAARAEDICKASAKLRSVCDEQGVALLAMRARLVYPGEFNELVDHHGSKGAALSHVTLELVRQVVDGTRTNAECGMLNGECTDADLSPHFPVPSPQSPIPYFICLDKHGGRNHYTALLQHHFSECWIEPISENRNRSRYRWTLGETPIEAIFRVGCEELLPTALASMTAKYHREVAMRAFNAFWQSRLPELRPTAGYPGDSRRFKADIAAVQAELGIDDRLLWRCR